jgi:hypothetical protein
MQYKPILYKVMYDFFKKIPKWVIAPIWLVVFVLWYALWSGIVNAFTGDDKNILFGVILVALVIAVPVVAGWFTYWIVNKDELLLKEQQKKKK